MANKKRGYLSINIGGKQRFMHFSMNFWANFTEEMNTPLDQIGKLFESGFSISAIRALVYSGLLAYDQEEGKDIDYNIFKVGVWLEDFDQKEFEKITTAMMESRILGNDRNMGIERNPETTEAEKKQQPKN